MVSMVASYALIQGQILGCFSLGRPSAVRGTLLDCPLDYAVPVCRPRCPVDVATEGRQLPTIIAYQPERSSPVFHRGAQVPLRRQNGHYSPQRRS
jgi:hypothetical protein